MTIDREMMLRLLREEVSSAEAERLLHAIEADAGLAAEYRRMQHIEILLGGAAADSFAPYFSDRVIKRLAAVASVPRAAFYDSMRWVFLRLATASLLVVIGLGAYNALESRDSDLAASTVEAVFGLPSADLDNLFYLQGI